VVSCGHSIVSERVESPRQVQPRFGSSTSRTTNCPSRTRASSSSRRCTRSSRGSRISVLRHGVESAPSSVTPFGRRVPNSWAEAAPTATAPAISHTSLLVIFALRRTSRNAKAFRGVCNMRAIHRSRRARLPEPPRNWYASEFGSPGSARRPARAASHRTSIVELDERQRVVVVHRDHELILIRVVAHRCRARNARGDNLRLLAGTNPRHAAEAHAAHVLRAVLEHHDAVVAALGRVLRANELAARIERQHLVVRDV